ncbi:MAG: threonylcarbamoyl-AMP synthase [Flavobacteriales bacterium]|nr:threonylcarbamoyl-AMP synthase [Flavobacteriales bacterium]
MATIGTDIQQAAVYLRNGELVAIPTETVYGLAANALDPDAVLRIFEAKQRPSFDPLIVHCKSFDAAMSYIKTAPRSAVALAEAVCPGPMTLILPKRDIVPDLVTSGHSTVGIRIPRHPVTQDLLNELDFPLAAPSANPFGYVSPTTAQHVDHQLGGRIPYILDGGPCEIGIESTIVSFEGEKPIVLRLGGLALEELEEALGEPLGDVRTSSSRPEAPGMLIAHYAPGKKVVFSFWASRPDAGVERSGQRVGLLCLSRPSDVPNDVPVIELSPSRDLKEAARNLFAALRAFDTMKVDLVIAEPLPDTQLGRAMNDRLKRAAASSS